MKYDDEVLLTEDEAVRYIGTLKSYRDIDSLYQLYSDIVDDDKMNPFRINVLSLECNGELLVVKDVLDNEMNRLSKLVSFHKNHLKGLIRGQPSQMV